MYSEDFLKKIIIEQPFCDGIALDIGARHGDYTEMLAHRFTKVYAFEPFPENIEILKKRFVRFNNVVIVPKAVSNKIGIAKLFLNGFDNGGSLSKMLAQLREWGYHENQFIEIETIILDEFCQNMDNISFIKVDIEGGENIIFEGAIKTLSKNSPIIGLEAHKIVDYERLNELFHSLGYKFFSTELEVVDELSPANHFLIIKG